LHTHQRALDAGDAEAGATVHFVTPELDGGPAILQAKVPILADDNASSLAARVLSVEHKIYPTVAQWFCSGRLEMKNGQAILDNQVLGQTGRTFSQDGER
jgi:phosphoribosylglycinamide formyltransferase-1